MESHLYSVSAPKFADALTFLAKKFEAFSWASSMILSCLSTNLFITSNPLSTTASWTLGFFKTDAANGRALFEPWALCSKQRYRQIRKPLWPKQPRPQNKYPQYWTKHTLITTLLCGMLFKPGTKNIERSLTYTLMLDLLGIFSWFHLLT